MSTFRPVSFFVGSSVGGIAGRRTGQQWSVISRDSRDELLLVSFSLREDPRISVVFEPIKVTEGEAAKLLVEPRTISKTGKNFLA